MGRFPLARLFVALGGLIILVLTAALVVPYFIDWSSYRADFEREASRALGRDVAVRGTATARLLPFPSLTFTDVVVGNGSDEPAMTVASFSMDAELGPLLSGEILIFDMRIEGADVLVRIDGQGMPDWAAQRSTSLEAAQVTLEKVTVTDARIRLVHEDSGREHVVDDIQAQLSARSLAGPWRADATMNVDGVETVVAISTGTLGSDGALRLRLRADPVAYPVTAELEGQARIDAEDGALFDGDFRVTASAEMPDPAATPAPPPDYRMSGRFALSHDRLAAETFTLETGPLADPYTAEGSAVLAMGEAPRFDISAEGVQLRFDEATGGSASFEERLAGLTRFFGMLPRPTIPGRIEVDLPAVIAGDTTIRDVRVAAEPVAAGWRIAAASATLPGRTTLEADGTLRVDGELDFEGSLLLAVRQPSGFAAWLSRDVDDAIRRLPAAGFSAEVRLSQTEQTFRDLELALGPSVFRGEISNSQPGDRRATMRLQLEGEGLDVDGMAAFASLFVTEGGRARFAGHDLDFEIVADDVAMAGLRAARVDTALRLRQGELEIDRLAVTDLAGTDIGAIGSIAGFPAAPTGTIEASVVSSDLAPLVRALADQLPGSAVLAGLADRAAMDPAFFRDTDFLVTADGSPVNGGTGGLTIRAEGQTGGTGIDISAAFDRIAPDLRTVPLDLSVEAAAQDATAIYTILGLAPVPLGMVGEGRATVTLDGTVAEGADLGVALAAEDFEARLDGTFTLSDTTRALDGIASVRSGDLEPWLMTAGVALPGFGLGLEAELSADVDYRDGLLVVSDLAGLAAGQPVSGDLNMETRGGALHVTGALGLEALDLALAAESVLGADAVAPADGWSNAPFAPAARNPITAELDIVADSAAFSGSLGIEDASMTLRVTADGLALGRFSGTALGGRITGNGEIRNDRGTGLLSAEVALEGGALEAIFPQGALSGTADIAATLTSTGKSIGALAASLSGSGSATTGAMTVDGLDDSALAGIVAAADEAGRDAGEARLAADVEAAVRSGSLTLEPAEFAFSIAGGAVRAAPVTLAAEAATMAVEPRANIAEGTIGLTGTLAFEAGDFAMVGSAPEIAMVVEGTADEAALAVDPQPMVQFLTQRALEREQQRVEAMQASLLEQQRLRREVRYFAALADERAEEEALRRREAPNVEDAQPLVPQQSSLPPSVSPEEMRERAARAAQIQADQNLLRAEEDAFAAEPEETGPADDAFFRDLGRFLEFREGSSFGDEFDTN